MIIPNATVRIERNDVVIYAAMRCQINWYAGDAVSGGRRGEHEGTLSARRGFDLRMGDIATLLVFSPHDALPPTTTYTLGFVAYSGQPVSEIIAPLFGGRREG